jgi:hypothetical protein
VMHGVAYGIGSKIEIREGRSYRQLNDDDPNMTTYSEQRGME